MEKKQQQYAWLGVGAVVLVMVIWLFSSKMPSDTPASGNSPVPTPNVPRPVATNLVGEIVVGAILPATGDQAVLGKTLQNAIDLATEDINAERGVVGKKLVFVRKDEECGGDQAQSLITAFQVQAIIGVVGGTCSSEKIGFVSAINDNNVIALAATGVADETANASGHLFRFVPPYAAEGTAAATYASGALRAKRATVLFGNTAQGKELAAAFSAGFKKNGGTVVSEVGVGLDENDVIGSIVPEIDVDVLYVVPASVSQMTRFLKAIKAQQSSALIVTTDLALAPTIGQTEKVLLEGVNGIAPLYDLQSERVQQFMRLYKARYGEEPAYPLYAANAYSQTYLLRDLIEKDGYDGAKMQKTLQAPLTGWSGGAFGKVDLDKTGDTLLRTFTAWKVEGGVLVSKGTIQ